MATDALVELRQRRGDWIASGRQFAGIGVHIGHFAPGNAAFDRRLGDCHRNGGDQPRVEWYGDDVLRTEARPCALISGDDVVGNVLAGETRQRADGCDLHLVIDGGGAHVERAAEDIGEAEDVVDLVRIVRAPCRHDGVVADAGDFFRRDFRIWIGHGEDDRPVGHGADHLLGEGILLREAEHDVGALHRFGERALVGLDRMRRLPLVHAFAAALIDHALGIAEDDVFRVEAHGLDQLDAGDGGRTGAVADQLGVLQVAAGQLQRVDETGGGDDGGAVLVVVEDRNVHEFAQPLLDDEAVRRLDVFQVDAAEGRAEIAHAIDEFVDILRIDLKVDRIDIGEALEEDRLAFHDRLGRESAEIAEAENGRAVGDDGDHVAA